jgi:3-dehydroquinate synthase
MHIIRSQTNNSSYPVYIGTDFIDSGLLQTLLPMPRIVLVTDQTVADIYLQTICETLTGFSLNLIILPPGEVNKNWEAVTKIIDVLVAFKHDRFSTLVSLGGGVIGDVTGFAASIFMRGINWLQLPTTLMAQVDAAVGGKTGCNYFGIKNLIGTFYQPQNVVIEIAFLRTLPDREYLSGLAEVVKYGMACDGEFFIWLEKHIYDLINRDPNILELAIHRCCQIKLELVQQDENDHGQRRVLNFGHTFAHALESATEFASILHGEAVAIGMLLATRLAVKLGLVERELLIRLYNLLNCIGLPLALPSEISSVGALYNFMMRDKKKQAAQLSLMLPCALGKIKVIQGLDLKCLEDLIQDYAST